MYESVQERRSRTLWTISDRLIHLIISGEYGDDRVCLSVCLCVCLSVREHIYGTTRSILPMAMARSSSGSVGLYNMYFRFYG